MAANPRRQHPTTTFRLPAARWLLSTRGRLALAVGMFVLSEVLTLPVLVVALVGLPYRGGAPIAQSEPELFWTALAVAVGLPVVCSLFLYARLQQAVGRLPAERRAAVE